MRLRRQAPDKPRRPRKAPANIPALLPKLRSGALSPESFLRATERDFERLASALMRPYRRTRSDGSADYELPASFDVHDIAQELRLLVLGTIDAWDPSRGCDLASFVIYKAMGRGARKINQERKAKRSDKNPGAEPSRYPLLLIDAVEREEREAMQSDALWQAAPPIAADIAVDASRAERFARVLAAAMGESVEDLARHVEKDPELRARARALAETEMLRGAL